MKDKLKILVVDDNKETVAGLKSFSMKNIRSQLHMTV